jgi:hypothetical protein
MYMHAWKRSTTSAPWLLYLRCLRYFGGRLTTPQVPNTLGTRTGRYRLTLRPFSSQEGPRLSRARAPLPVYAVYAMSSLDTGSSLLRHGTQTAWGFVGTPQGVAGPTPRPFTAVCSVYFGGRQDGAWFWGKARRHVHPHAPGPPDLVSPSSSFICYSTLCSCSHQRPRLGRQ